MFENKLTTDQQKGTIKNEIERKERCIAILNRQKIDPKTKLPRVNYNTEVADKLAAEILTLNQKLQSLG